MQRRGLFRGRTGRVMVVSCVIALGLPAAALAHVERTSYWPDPRPDTTVTPAAGGAVPKVRSLASALDTSAPGSTRVVCQADSLDRLRASISGAETSGFSDRPTESPRKLSATAGASLLSINGRLFQLCSYHEIQPAVTASHNNDRVVIMPGVYTEPESRAV